MVSGVIAVEELGMGRTGLLEHPFMAQCIKRFFWTQERREGNGLQREWLGTISHQTPASAPRIPLWSCSPSGKAKHKDKDFTGKVECGYSTGLYKVSICRALSLGCAQP